MPVKKIVIPKGLIDPNETVIVMIPENLQTVTTLVAHPTRKPPVPPAHHTSFVSQNRNVSRNHQKPMHKDYRSPVVSSHSNTPVKNPEVRHGHGLPNPFPQWPPELYSSGSSVSTDCSWSG